jgi:glutamine amidotransferase
MIVVIDYKVGNVKSVCKAFEYLGFQAKLSSDISDIESAGGLVLPGVAAFGFARDALGDLDKIITKQAQKQIPLLGICVGFQLLFEKSCEHGQHKGLALIKGEIAPIPKGRVIPHMGWNQVELNKDIDLFEEFNGDRFFYFAHSYYAQITDKKTQVANTDYGFEIPAAVKKENIYGTQFHPEKSGQAGLKVLKNFASICKRQKNVS